MSGGAMGVGGEGSPLGGGAGAGGAPTGTATTTGANPGAYTPSNTTRAPAQSYYDSLVQPNAVEQNVTQAYQQTLGRTPEEAGMSYWANQARTQGWNGQQLAQAIQNAGAPERAISGFQSQYNPSSYGQQALNRPSYYNTNPVGVDYANIFNPAAQSVTYNQPTLTPGQQAQYLGNWAQQYSQMNRAATDAAALERKNTANAQWNKYFTDKAKAEAQAVASNQEAINKAVEEKLSSMGYSGNNNSYNSYGGKAGGVVPGGLRSLKGKTKP